MFGRVLTALILAATLPLSARGEPSPTTTHDNHDPAADVPRLIDGLSDPDYSIRKQSTDQLIERGNAIRPQIIRASRAADPEERARAAEILRRLPWSIDGDPPAVRQLLDQYGPAPEIGRERIIARLSELPGCGPAIFRLLNEEPGDTVRWYLVYVLSFDRFGSDDAKLRQRMREIEPESDDAQALMVSASAWAERDRAKSLALYRRAVDADRRRPSNDQGLLNFAYNALTDAALADARFDDAAELLRMQVPRDTTLLGPRGELTAALGSGGVNLARVAALMTRQLRERETGDSRIASLAALAALHRYLGPLRGFEQDRQTWGRSGGRSGGRSREPATAGLAARVAGLMSSLGSTPPLPTADDPFALAPEDRYAAAAFLIQHKFVPAAEMELGLALQSRSQPARRTPPATEFECLYLLARTVAEQGRDAEAADLIERAARVQSENRLTLDDASDQDLRLEIAWRRAKAAHASGDSAVVTRFLADLAQCSPGNNDTTITCVRWLKEVGRNDAAKALFAKVYEQSHNQLVATGETDPGAQNDLAWLCARCGERLDEAVRLAKAAVDSSPDTAAYIDTLAEAQYRSGNRDEAIKLESRAAELTPDNEFMKEQVERFKAGRP